MLRAARALIQAKVSRRRIRRSLEDLRRHLPDNMPLSGLSICAVGDRVVVRDGNNHFQVDDGQYVLGLDVSVENGVLRVVEKDFAAESDTGGAMPPPKSAEDWFDNGLDLEENGDIDAAIEAYEQTAALDAQNVAAWINWGRLLHERGNKREAEDVYRRAIEQCGAGRRADVQSRRAARRSGAHPCGARGLSGRGRARIRAWPTVTTTSRGSTNRSASHSTPSAISASTAAC